MEERDFVSRRNLINDPLRPPRLVGEPLTLGFASGLTRSTTKDRGVEGVEGRNIVTRFLGFRPRKRLAAESLAGWWCGGEDGKVP